MRLSHSHIFQAEKLRDRWWNEIAPYLKDLSSRLQLQCTRLLAQNDTDHPSDLRVWCNHWRHSSCIGADEGTVCGGVRETSNSFYGDGLGFLYLSSVSMPMMK